MRKVVFFLIAWTLSSAALVSCAAPAPTATPTAAPAAAATPTKAPTATPTKMPMTKIVVTSSLFASLNYPSPNLAKGKGYFQEESLDADWVIAGSGAKALTAVVGRSAEVGLPASQDTISAIAQAQPVKAFALVTSGKPYFMVVRKEIAQQRGITPQMSVAEKGRAVKGLTFAASSPGSGTDQMTRYFLISAGLDPDRDVQITYIASTAFAAAINSGSVDAVTSSQADPTLDPIRRGVAVMLANFTTGDVPGLAETLEIAAVGHRDEMQARPEIFEAFTRAIWKAERLLVQNPNEAKEVIRKTAFPDMDTALFEDYWKASAPGFAKSPEISEKGFVATLDFRNKVESGPPLTAKFSDFYEPKFVEAAKKQLGY